MPDLANNDEMDVQKAEDSDLESWRIGEGSPPHPGHNWSSNFDTASWRGKQH